MSDLESTRGAHEPGLPRERLSQRVGAPPISPAPRLWHQFCNRTLHITAIPDVPTSLPSR